MIRFLLSLQTNYDPCLVRILLIFSSWVILVGILCYSFLTRIRFYTQEICIYREEVLEELAKNSIHFQENNDPSASVGDERTSEM